MFTHSSRALTASFGLAAAALLAVSVGGSERAYSATYYVSPVGSDSNNGLSTATPFRTLGRASSGSQPGDTIYAMSGTYSNPCLGCSALNITHSGTATAPITFAAYPGQHPIVDSTNNWVGIHIDASYIVLSGFEVTGNAQSITLAQAQAQQNNLSNIPMSTSGIEVVDDVTPGVPPTHVTVINNIVHDCPGNGIEAEHADYVTISNNTVYRNAYWSPYADSGISLYELRDSDQNQGYKNYVMNNVAYSNQEFIPFYAQGKITDGNGIIIDDNMNTQSNNVPYGGRTLVANNVSYLNGGSGIHAFSSQHVDIIANTAYFNNQSSNLKLGQIFGYDAADVNILNNIMYAPSSKPAMTSNGNGASVTEDYNLIYGPVLQKAIGNMIIGAHDVVSNPQFTNPTAGNFTLTASSPAMIRATHNMEPATDILGVTRPLANAPDLGAYQMSH